MKNKPKSFSKFLLDEDGTPPVNTAGSGAIAGLPPDIPPFPLKSSKKLNILRRKKPPKV